MHSERNAIEEKKSCNQKIHQKNIFPIKRDGGDKTNLYPVLLTILIFLKLNADLLHGMGIQQCDGGDIGQQIGRCKVSSVADITGVFLCMEELLGGLLLTPAEVMS